MKEAERDIERRQKGGDVTETDRQDGNGQTEMWTARERTDERGMMRRGENREEERKVSSSKTAEEAQQFVKVKNKN